MSTYGQRESISVKTSKALKPRIFSPVNLSPSMVYHPSYVSGALMIKLVQYHTDVVMIANHGH